MSEVEEPTSDGPNAASSSPKEDVIQSPANDNNNNNNNNNNDNSNKASINDPASDNHNPNSNKNNEPNLIPEKINDDAKLDIAEVAIVKDVHNSSLEEKQELDQNNDQFKNQDLESPSKLELQLEKEHDKEKKK